MARPLELRDVQQGPPADRKRLLAPLNYLRIYHPEKTRYDLILPVVVTVVLWVLYLAVEPKPALFGEAGLLKFTRDLLVMAVPFFVGALASVAMGSPGPHIDDRPIGSSLVLDGEVLTLRQFVCYLLGYLCLLGLVTLAGAVAAELLRPIFRSWTSDYATVRIVLRSVGALGLLGLLSTLSVTVLWALYFLTDIVNHRSR